MVQHLLNFGASDFQTNVSHGFAWDFCPFQCRLGKVVLLGAVLCSGGGGVFESVFVFSLKLVFVLTISYFHLCCFCYWGIFGTWILGRCSPGYSAALSFWLSFPRGR